MTISRIQQDLHNAVLKHYPYARQEEPILVKRIGRHYSNHRPVDTFLVNNKGQAIGIEFDGRKHHKANVHEFQRKLELRTMLDKLFHVTASNFAFFEDHLVDLVEGRIDDRAFRKDISV